jgi:DNA-binding transcriptional MerR regulator
MEVEYISKKELLMITGISYGQLYRWKRENLIPEEWFVKKSSFTGQETFFPKDKILQRIKTIQQLKDSYPLEDLARMLSPELTGITYRVSRVLSGDVMDISSAKMLQDKIGQEFCSFWEACVLFTLGQARTDGFLSGQDMERIAYSLPEWELNSRSGAYKLYVLRTGDVNTVILGAKEPPMLLDKALKVMKVYDLDEMGSILKSKINAL